MGNSSETSLLIFLIMFWTFLTIFSNIFIAYIETPLSSDISNFTPDNTEMPEDNKSLFENIIGVIFDTLEEIPILNIIVPLVKIMTFSYTQVINPLVSIFLNGLMILTYYVVWSIIRK